MTNKEAASQTLADCGDVWQVWRPESCQRRQEPRGLSSHEVQGQDGFVCTGEEIIARIVKLQREIQRYQEVIVGFEYADYEGWWPRDEEAFKALQAQALNALGRRP